MSDDPSLKVVFCWHMHQPDYRDDKGCPVKPWTYLRAIKDYTDMAGHLESVDQAQAVVNFSPVLLEQLAFYSQQIQDYLELRTPLKDPLMAELAAKTPGASEGARKRILQLVVDSQHHHFGGRYKSYLRLQKFAEYLLEHSGHQALASESFYADLLVWFHLAWTGETVHRSDSRILRLIAKESQFSFDDRQGLIEVIGEQIDALIPRYRALQDINRIELSMSPYAHPLAPLLLDFNSAHEATPEIALPDSRNYPGGMEQLQWQIERGLDIFQSHFGQRPAGCWPSEGAISEAFIEQLARNGFLWAASGSAVLANSQKSEHESQTDFHTIHRGYQLKDQPIRCFFRDDGLSDLIGFQYSNWHAEDAVSNLVHHLENIHRDCHDRQNALVAIIMDGENAWEHYPDNAFHFLQALYRRLANHPKMELTTFSNCLSQGPQNLQHLVAGSWVYGNLTTWIGCRDKNRAWDMLVDAKQEFDRVIRANSLSPDVLAEARQRMAICEGSDWFWWPGGNNPPATVQEFDALFRTQLQALYRCLGSKVPGYLKQPFTEQTSTGNTALGGVMRKSSQ